MLSRHIFISFKTEEREVAARLNGALSEAGHAVWWQEDIQCGREWHGAIDEALANAGCVIVLWSEAAMRSPWVRHEASQAIARGCYAPARLEPIVIGSPYDRLQATDLDSWDGSPNHPGFARLLARVNELLPQPIPPATAALLFLNRNKWTIATSVFAIAAVSLLVALTIALSRQIEVQQQIALDLRRTLQPLENMEVTAFITINQSSPGVNDFVAMLRKELGKEKKGLFAFRANLPPGVHQVISQLDGTTLAVSIERKSPLWPQGANYQWLSGTVDFTGLSIAVRRRDPEPDSGATSTAPPIADPDLSFSVAPYDPDGSEGTEVRGPSLEWEPASGTLTLRFTDGVGKRFWKSNGKVGSVPDLEDSAISVQVDDSMFPAQGDRTIISKTRAALELRTLFLNYSGRDVMIRASDMHAYRTGKGLREYRAYMSGAAQRK